MLTLLGLHFVGGVLLGLRFRFAVVFAVAAVAGLEGPLAQYWLGLGPWYAVSFWTLIASQAGYVASAFFMSAVRPAAIANRHRASLPSEAVH